MAELLASVELAAGRFGAHVYATQLDGIPCWTYVSGGLSQLGQAELLLSLRRSRKERAFPEAPLHYLHSVFEAAEHGNLVHEGGITEYRGVGPFGDHFTGIAYLRARPVDGLALPARVLSATVLTGPEVHVAAMAGVTRVAARLGELDGVFPRPPWSDLERRAVFDDRAVEASLLGQIPVFHGYDNTVVQEGGSLRVQLSYPEGDWVPEAANLAPEAPVALPTSCDRNATACLVWQPGQDEPTAISDADSDGSRISGCFVGFVPGHDDDGFAIHEDGFLVTLTPSSWARVRAALFAAEDVVLDGPGGSFVEIRWTGNPDSATPDETLPAYVDRYFASEAASWATPQPSRAEGSPFVTLLMSDGLIAERVATGDLARFVQQARQAVATAVPSLSDTTPREVRIDVCVYPAAGGRLRVSARPPLAAEDEQRLRAAVLNCPLPPVINGPILFQISHPLFS